MYSIKFSGKTFETPLPCFVCFDSRVDSFRTCSESEAEAVLVSDGDDQVYCDLATKNVRHDGFPVAVITEG